MFYVDYDLEEVVCYGKEKGVDLVMYYEILVVFCIYEQQLDMVYVLMQWLGIYVVKIGYVGFIILEGECYYGQWMVWYYCKVLEIVVCYQVVIDVYELIKVIGFCWIYLNMMLCEGLCGQEFNVWLVEGGNFINYLSVVVFMWMLVGLIDYMLGIFNLMLKFFKLDNQVKYILVYELVLYVVIYSLLQMMVDLFEYVEGQFGMQWVCDVVVDWE